MGYRGLVLVCVVLSWCGLFCAGVEQNLPKSTTLICQNLLNLRYLKSEISLSFDLFFPSFTRALLVASSATWQHICDHGPPSFPPPLLTLFRLVLVLALALALVLVLVPSRLAFLQQLAFSYNTLPHSWAVAVPRRPFVFFFFLL